VAPGANGDIRHVSIADEADLLLVAPATPTSSASSRGASPTNALSTL